MSLDARIRELDARHRSLDLAIRDELKRPGGDSLQLSDLKRKKLRIKEELEALRSRPVNEGALLHLS
ncbi:MAG: YdcH family protein [Maricaulaceae bacterium]